MEKRNKVEEVYKSIIGCSSCGATNACVYSKLRAYMDKCGLKEFERQLTMGVLPREIGEYFEMKLDIINRS